MTEERFQFLKGDVVGVSALGRSVGVRRRFPNELGVVLRTPRARTCTVAVIWDRREEGAAVRKYPDQIHADYLDLILRD